MSSMELRDFLLLTTELNIAFCVMQFNISKLKDSLGNICFAKYPFSEELYLLFPEMENVSV